MEKKVRRIVYINYWFDLYKNKTLAQLAGFLEENYETYILALDNQENIIKLYRYSTRSKLEIIAIKELNEKKKKRFWCEIFEKTNIFLEKISPDMVYIRRFVEPIFYSKRFFSQNYKRKIKMVYEIPTFPLDKSGDSLTDFRSVLEYFYYLVFIYRYVDLTTVIVQNKVRLLKKMMPISNVIDIESYSISRKPELQNVFKMVAVAHVQYWHGYDYLIRAMIQYKGKYTLNLTIISTDTPENQKLQSLVRQYKLSDRVFFEKDKSIDEIQKICNQCHIGIGGLRYSLRSGIYDTSLKNKEYCAMGLPFLYEIEDLSFPSSFPYMKKVNVADGTIDFDDIIEWYSHINMKNYKAEMYTFAKRELQFTKYVKSIEKELS